MATDVEQTQLMAFLRTKHNQYFGKVLELRDQVKGWLAYIPQTFPHYTRHTVEHSDEIVAQISKLLFKSGRKTPVMKLTPTEAYILAAAAYLHDAGMVVSDSEKAMILESDEWKAWTTEGGGATRWQQIEAFRSGDQPEEPSSRHFLADVQARHLIAEFVRPSHHRRAAAVIAQHEVDLGLFAFRDRVLRDAIADVCVAHGLRQHELEDPDRYPDFTQIQGEDVNLRFLAIILRLGDLLDLTHDRACPWLMNAASPLPPTSFAHWSQYQRITRRSTAPDRITITAKCQTQDEHRVLQDWCQWIVDEVAQARTLMATANRHANWTPPEASLRGPSPTIKIDPEAGAKYFWSEWKLELDNEAIFERLIHDVYDSPETFIRELIQNALDANRCQMYADLKADGIQPPEYPTQVEEERRLRYPVRIALDNRQFKNELSGEEETRQVLIVEDCGLGMDKDVIQRYFLQIGRSYYTTEEFRRSFGFVPISRFGIGFLSVFAVSSQVTVETYKPSSSRQDGPLRLTLGGPRNYLLTEQGSRPAAGTRIEVLLEEPMDKGTLGKLVSRWCRRVEFPITINDLGTDTTVIAESLEQFTYEVPDVNDEEATLAVRAFPLDCRGIEGEMYIFTLSDDRGESWIARKWAEMTYPGSHPNAIIPPFPESITCLQGILVSSQRSVTEHGPSFRIDYRGRFDRVSLSRQAPHSHVLRSLEPELLAQIERIVLEHLASSRRCQIDSGWEYKNTLAKNIPLPGFWSSVPGMVPLFLAGRPFFAALEELKRMRTMTVVPTSSGDAHRSDSDAPLLEEGCISSLYSEAMFEASPAFEGRTPTNVRFLPCRCLAIDWVFPAEGASQPSARFDVLGDPIYVLDFPEEVPVGTFANRLGQFRKCFLLNARHPLTRWLERIEEESISGRHSVTKEQFATLLNLLRHALELRARSIVRFMDYLAGWRDMSDLPQDLHPPQLELDHTMFSLPSPPHSPT